MCDFGKYVQIVPWFRVVSYGAAVPEAHMPAAQSHNASFTKGIFIVVSVSQMQELDTELVLTELDTLTMKRSGKRFHHPPPPTTYPSFYLPLSLFNSLPHLSQPSSIFNSLSRLGVKPSNKSVLSNILYKRSLDL